MSLQSPGTALSQACAPAPILSEWMNELHADPGAWSELSTASSVRTHLPGRTAVRKAKELDRQQKYNLFSTQS